MATTIQISNKLVEMLKARKQHDKETYEEVILDLIEDTQELSEETKKDIAQAEEEYKQGKTVSFDRIKK